MIYSYELFADAHDADAEGVLRPAPLLRYMQTAANLQLETYGPKSSELLENGRAFILSRIAIDFLSPVHSYDPLTVMTWPCESRGYSFQRCHKIENKGETVAQALSLWALMDIHAHRPLRVDAQPLNFTTEEAFLPKTPLRFTLPKEMTVIGTHTVSYSDTDRNRHMNNTRYLDMLTDALAPTDIIFTGVSIAYLHEAPFGTEVTILSAKENDKIYFKTLLPDGSVNVEACFHIQPKP